MVYLCRYTLSQESSPLKHSLAPTQVCTSYICTSTCAHYHPTIYHIFPPVIYSSPINDLFLLHLIYLPLFSSKLSLSLISLKASSPGARTTGTAAVIIATTPNPTAKPIPIYFSRGMYKD